MASKGAPSELGDLDPTGDFLWKKSWYPLVMTNIAIENGHL
jgi:hypothetical protein